MKDKCYYSVKGRYAKWPSARASQALAKCRKKNHAVRRGKSGAALKRWAAEKWVNTHTGRPCGNSKDKTEYCRPSKRVSSKTPTTSGSISASKRAANYNRKKQGLRAKRV